MPSHKPLADTVIDAAAKIGEHRELTPGVTTGYAHRRNGIIGRGDVTTLVPGAVRVDDHGFGWATPTFVVTSVDTLLNAGGDLLDEAFGPLFVIVEYDDAATLAGLAE